MGKLVLVQEVESVLKELKALAAQNRSGLLGPKVLLEYEVSSLSEALEKAKQQNCPDALQQCLVESKRLLSQLQQSHLLEDAPK